MKTKKMYKVVLNKNHKAKENQIIDGCLGNGFNCGEVHLYTRGEAIKKAKTFNGKIKLASESKFIFVQMLSREGEFSTTVKTVHELDVNEDVNIFADELARDYYNDINVEDNGREWLHNNGCIATSILKVQELDYGDYEVLTRYI